MNLPLESKLLTHGTFSESGHSLPRVISVDDEPDVARLIAKTMTRAGFAADYVTSGHEALERLDTTQYDLMITDIQMPGMRGTELQRLTHDRYPDTAIMMVTASNEVATAVQCLHLGAYDYLVKPFDLTDLIARAKKAIHRRRIAIEHRVYRSDLESKVAEQAERIRGLSLESLQALINALEAKDQGTSQHSSRVSILAVQLAKQMCPDASAFREWLRMAALLHDLGKIGVREDLLLSPRTLTISERREIEQHPAIGERILRPLFAGEPDILAMIRHHHERWDGLGYPDGLAGDAIPVGSRIIAVADSFDAMTSTRPYRAAMSHKTAAEILSRGAGDQWDASAVAALLEYIGKPENMVGWI